MASDFPKVPLGGLVQNFDSKRVPLSSREREKRRGPYPYYGATGVMDHLDDYLFEGLHLLIAEDGSVETQDGYPFLQLVNGRFWVNNHAHVLRAQCDSDTRYLYHALSTVKIRPYMTGSVQAKLSQRNMNRILVPYADDALIRRAITCILGALDDKIELNRRMNQTLEAMARAVFKSWFVDFDPVRAKPEGRDPGLPDHIAALFPDSFEKAEDRPVPAGWKIDRLDAVAPLRKQSVKPMQTSGRVWEHYSIPAFDAGRVPVFETGASIKSAKYRVPASCVLVSKLNPQFTRVWLPDVRDQEVAICSTEFMPFVPLHPAWRSFLYELMKSNAVQQGIQERVTGSTGSRQRAKPEDVAMMQVVVPTPELIEAFGRTVGPLHKKALACISECRTLSLLRDTLLPKLISGELRVRDPGRIAGRCV